MLSIQHPDFKIFVLQLMKKIKIIHLVRSLSLSHTVSFFSCLFILGLSSFSLPSCQQPDQRTMPMSTLSWHQTLQCCSFLQESAKFRLKTPRHNNTSKGPFIAPNSSCDSFLISYNPCLFQSFLTAIFSFILFVCYPSK